MIRKSGVVNGHFVALGSSCEKYSNHILFTLKVMPSHEWTNFRILSV